MSTSVPIILLAFANDHVDGSQYLRNLPKERKQIEAVLKNAEQAGLCEVKILHNATLKEILDAFQEHRNRIAMFHYAGHAGGYELLLETPSGQTQEVSAWGFAQFLSEQENLHFVFLNGCSTRQQVINLQAAHIPVLIATSSAIDDAIACDFATRFYKAVATGASLKTAYNEAQASIGADKGEATRELYRPDRTDLDDETLPWQLFPEDNSNAVFNWNLPEVVGDPLFALPKIPKADLPPLPFRYLNRFSRTDAEVFFGQGNVIRTLYESLTSDTSENIILFYGQSGAGKSSLLEAGLLPRLEPSHLVRLERRNSDGLLATLEQALGGSVDTWKNLEKLHQQPLVIILDQCEEVFTQAKDTKELETFLSTVKTIFSNLQFRPEGKLMLSFRKAWLPEFMKRFDEARLTTKKVFLERMSHEDVMQVVESITKTERLQNHYNLTIEEGLANLIAGDLLEDPDAAIAATLQVLLSKMWDEATKQSPSQPHFSTELYQRLKRQGLLLEDFLKQQSKHIAELQPEHYTSGLLFDVLSFHTTDLGTAREHLYKDVQASYQKNVTELLQTCKDHYLLTDQADEGQEKKYTRLSHDTLAPLVRKTFADSDLPGQRARRILENRVADSQDNAAPLDRYDLHTVERGQAGMRQWTSAEQQLVVASQEKREREDRRYRVFSVTLAGALGAGILLSFVQAFIAAVIEKKFNAWGNIFFNAYMSGMMIAGLLLGRFFAEWLESRIQNQKTKQHPDPIFTLNRRWLMIVTGTLAFGFSHAIIALLINLRTFPHVLGLGFVAGLGFSLALYVFPVNPIGRWLLRMALVSLSFIGAQLIAERLGFNSSLIIIQGSSLNERIQQTDWWQTITGGNPLLSQAPVIDSLLVGVVMTAGMLFGIHIASRILRARR